MEYILKSRILGRTFKFFKVSGRTSYIFVNLNGHEGTLGNQLVRMNGSAYFSDDENFKKTCKTWYREYVKFWRT